VKQIRVKRDVLHQVTVQELMKLFTLGWTVQTQMIFL